jgi:uncharacterized membrane protein
MSMMKESMSMLTRVTSRMPRHLYFGIKRFFLLAASFTAGIVGVTLIFKSIDWSVALFGNPFPAITIMILGILGVASYYMAKIDVDLEKREQERVLRQLERE